MHFWSTSPSLLSSEMNSIHALQNSTVQTKTQEVGTTKRFHLPGCLELSVPVDTFIVSHSAVFTQCI